MQRENETEREYYRRTVYSTQRWKRLRLQYIGAHPDNALCFCCLNKHSICCSGVSTTTIARMVKNGVLFAGTLSPVYIVDHVLSIRNGGEAFDLSNLRSFCLNCHSRKARIDNLDNKMQDIIKSMNDLGDWS